MKTDVLGVSACVFANIFFFVKQTEQKEVSAWRPPTPVGTSAAINAHCIIYKTANISTLSISSGKLKERKFWD